MPTPVHARSGGRRKRHNVLSRNGQRVAYYRKQKHQFNEEGLRWHRPGSKYIS